MGNPRPRPKLLHEKLVAIRKYLNVDQQDLAAWLKLPHAGRVSEYESDVREPNLMVLLAYTVFAKVHMESLVDDQVSVTEFRAELGTVEPRPRAQPKSQPEAPIHQRPVTLLHGTR